MIKKLQFHLTFTTFSAATGLCCIKINIQDKTSYTSQEHKENTHINLSASEMTNQ